MKTASSSFSLIGAVRLFGFNRMRRMRKASSSGWEALISPHFMTRVIQTLYHVGYVDVLRDHAAVDAQVFAQERGLNASLMVGLCDSLYARGIFARRGSTYSLDKAGQFLADTNLVHGWFDLVYGYEPVLNNMEQLLRQESTYGHDTVRDGRFVATGSGLASLDFYFPIVSDFISRAGYRRVLDIGCGDGAFLSYLCGRIPGLKGVGVDLSPDAVEAGNQSVAALGLEDRIDLHVGDALDIGLLKNELKGVDAAATFFVLHELCDQENNPRAVRFLSEFRRALPGVPLHVIETIRPDADELRRRPGMAVEYFLFHDLSLQKPIGRDGWKKAFRDAGFQSLQEFNIGFARSAIYTAQ